MKKIILYGVVIFQLAVVYSLSRSLYTSVQSRSRVDDLRIEKIKLEEENIELVTELDHVSSDYYIEEVAREQLHFTKPGETVLIVDKEEIENVLGEEDSVLNEENVPIWKKWLNLIIGKSL